MCIPQLRVSVVLSDDSRRHKMRLAFGCVKEAGLLEYNSVGSYWSYSPCLGFDGCGVFVARLTRQLEVASLQDMLDRKKNLCLSPSAPGAPSYPESRLCS